MSRCGIPWLAGGRPCRCSRALARRRGSYTCCTCGAGVAGACTVDAAMSIPRSPRFVEDKEIIPPRARWHGDLPSTLGHATLSRVKSSPSMRFGTSPRTSPGVVRGRTSAFVCSGHHGLFSPASCLCAPAERHRPTTANSSCHAYNVPLSTLSRVSSAKWGSRKDLRRVEVMKSKRDKDLAVGPYAQYPGEMPSTIGATAVRGGGMWRRRR